MNTRSISFLFSAFVVFVGCSDAEVDKYPSVASFCNALAKTECDAVSGKCGVTSEACLKTRLASCEAFAATAKAGNLRDYKSSGVENCLTKTKSTLGKEKILPADDEAQFDACNRVFAGSVAQDKGTCTTKYDCAGSDLICDQAICVRKDEKAKDGYCSDPGSVCPTGQYCGVNAVTKQQCLGRKQKGEACDAATLCSENLACTGGLCADKSKAGEACTSNADCDSAVPVCDLGPPATCIDARRFTKGASSCKDYSPIP